MYYIIENYNVWTMTQTIYQHVILWTEDNTHFDQPEEKMKNLFSFFNIWLLYAHGIIYALNHLACKKLKIYSILRWRCQGGASTGTPLLSSVDGGVSGEDGGEGGARRRTRFRGTRRLVFCNIIFLTPPRSLPMRSSFLIKSDKNLWQCKLKIN